MDTSEPMDIEQLCAMQPQHSSTPPCSNQGSPPSAATANLPKTNLPGQGPPPTSVTQGAEATLAFPPTAGVPPATAKAALVAKAVGLKAGATPAGPPKNPSSTQKAPLLQ